jgi:hypothetical protein
MRGQLSIQDRQAQLITRLKNINQKQKIAIKDLKSELAVKDKQIAKLEEQLRDKEKQRREMLARWYKPSKKQKTTNRENQGNNHTIAPTRPTAMLMKSIHFPFVTARSAKNR